MWSLATRLPNLLVIPRSSSFISKPYLGRFWGSGACRTALGASSTRLLAPSGTASDHEPAGEFFDSTVMVPAMISSCSFVSSSVRPAGSFDSKSWKLESLTPWFFSVPM